MRLISSRDTPAAATLEGNEDGVAGRGNPEGVCEGRCQSMQSRRRVVSEKRWEVKGLSRKSTASSSRRAPPPPDSGEKNQFYGRRNQRAFVRQALLPILVSGTKHPRVPVRESPWLP